MSPKLEREPERPGQYQRPRPRPRRQGGLSLIEHVVVLGITGVSIAAAVPSLDDLRWRHAVGSAASQLETELQYTRSLAVARNQNVRFTMDTIAERSCYVIHTGGPNDCSCTADGSASCTDGATALRSASVQQLHGLTLTSSARSVAFDGSRGTVTPTTTLRLHSRQGDAVHVVVNIMGRIRSCSASERVSDLPRC